MEMPFSSTLAAAAGATERLRGCTVARKIALTAFSIFSLPQLTLSVRLCDYADCRTTLSTRCCSAPSARASPTAPRVSARTNKRHHHHCQVCTWRLQRRWATGRWRTYANLGKRVSVAGGLQQGHRVPHAAPGDCKGGGRPGGGGQGVRQPWHWPHALEADQDAFIRKPKRHSPGLLQTLFPRDLSALKCT